MTDETPVAVADAPVADAPVPDVEETVTLPKAEADALRRQAAESERARKRLETDQRKAEEARQAEQGEWQKLAEQRQAELEQERARASRFEQEQRVSRAAARLKFIDPADVIGRLSAEDAADEDAALAALERLAQSSPHLIAKDQPAAPVIGQVLAPSAPSAPGATPAGDGKPQPPAGSQPLQSLDQWEALPQAERSARMAEADWLIVHGQ